MPKGSLYAAHRAAGAASGRYKASLYDIANVGYEMEADVGIEQFRQSQTQEKFATIGEALGLAETIRGSFESKKRHEELTSEYDLQKPEKQAQPKEPTQPKVPTIGSKTNPFDISDVGDLFRQAKKAGVEEGSKIWGKIGDEVKEWLYEYK